MSGLIVLLLFFYYSLWPEVTSVFSTDSLLITFLCFGINELSSIWVSAINKWTQIMKSLNEVIELIVSLMLIQHVAESVTTFF